MVSAKQQPLPPKKRLDAIEWSANQQGMSYGQFVITLSEQDKRHIYDEYEVFLEERTKKINAVIVSHKRG